MTYQEKSIVEKICKNCRYWQDEVCQKFSNNRNAYIVKLANTYTRSHQYIYEIENEVIDSIFIETDESFGCNQWKKSEW